MKTRTMISALVAAVLLSFGIGAGAQRSSTDQTQQDQSTQGQSAPGMMGGGMMGQSGMMGMMGQMSTHHQQMTTLMNQLMESMKEIMNEKDPAALKTKLEEHQKLLNEMRSQMMGQGNRINMMSGQIQQNCPMSGTSNKPATK